VGSKERVDQMFNDMLDDIHYIKLATYFREVRK